jgi:hypothetical protein
MKYACRLILLFCSLFFVGGCAGVDEKEFKLCLNRVAKNESEIGKLSNFQLLASNQIKSIEADVGKLEDASGKLQKQVTDNTTGLNSLKTRYDQLDKQVSSEIKSRIIEDESLKKAVTDEHALRNMATAKLADMVAERDANQVQVRQVLRDTLLAELQAMTQLIETKRTLQDLVKRGILTEEEIEASKLLAIEDGLWVNRVKELKKSIESLSPSQ